MIKESFTFGYTIKRNEIMTRSTTSAQTQIQKIWVSSIEDLKVNRIQIIEDLKFEKVDILYCMNLMSEKVYSKIWEISDLISDTVIDFRLKDVVTNNIGGENRERAMKSLPSSMR